MAIYLFIKLIEKLSRQHLINSSDVFVIKGFTVLNPVIPQSKFTYHSDLTSGDL